MATLNLRQERGLFRWKWLRESYKSCCTWYTAGVELLQQLHINGRGSVQAVIGNCCMHMRKRNKGRSSLCICYKQILLLWKVGVTHKAVAAVFGLPNRAFSILCLT